MSVPTAIPHCGRAYCTKRAGWDTVQYIEDHPDAFAPPDPRTRQSINQSHRLFTHSIPAPRIQSPREVVSGECLSGTQRPPAGWGAGFFLRSLTEGDGNAEGAFPNGTADGPLESNPPTGNFYPGGVPTLRNSAFDHNVGSFDASEGGGM